jgi:predicted enzyme related to lactoylglutathione lyase
MASIARVDYVELCHSETGALKDFYGKAFGWTFTDYGPQYAAFHDGREGEAGGFNATGAKAAPLVVLYADDLDAARQGVLDAGGEVISEHDFPGGKRFHFRDPAGNELAVATAVAE